MESSKAPAPSKTKEDQMDTKRNQLMGSKKKRDGQRHPWARVGRPSPVSTIIGGSGGKKMTDTVDRYMARGGAIKLCPTIRAPVDETGALADARVAREVADGKIQMVVGL